ncbi:MAG: hypothetical protein K9L24_02270 [Spirochaetia bacterium]|nr:hypothetical protein [Spirochaetia bacterium]MCF7953026.1 hypothetical protein [Spirochaetales bacterium]
MHIDDFEEDFLPQILFRGFDYYKRALVQNLSRSGNVWTAQVTGGKRYTVEVEFSQNGKITDLSCDCPYDWDSFCKHEAAVLFKLQDVLMDEEPEEGSIAEQVKTLSLLEDLSREQLISLVREMVELKPELGLLVRAIAAEPEHETGTADKLNIVDELITTVLKELQVFDAYKADRLGYFDIPDYPDGLLQRVFSLLHESLWGGKYQEVIAIASVLLGRVAEACYEGIDCDGELMTVYAKGFDFIVKVCALDELTDAQRKEFIEDLLSLSSEVACFDVVGWEYDLIEQANYLCRETAHTEVIEKFIEKQVEEEQVVDLHSSYRKKRQLLLLYHIYKNSRPKEFVDEFLFEHIDFPELRKLAVDRAVDEGRLDGAEALALEGERQARERLAFGLENDFMLKRCCIYEIAGLTEKLRAVLQDMLFSFGDFDLFDRYKSTFLPQQWPAAASDLLIQYAELEESEPGLFRRDLYANMLLAEEQYKQLYDLVAAHPQMVLNYDEVLLPEYTEEVYSIYSTLIMQRASEAAKRTEYHRVCGLIGRLKSINGEREAEACKSEIRAHYFRKPAFMDELQKV